MNKALANRLSCDQPINRAKRKRHSIDCHNFKIIWPIIRPVLVLVCAWNNGGGIQFWPNFDFDSINV